MLGLSASSTHAHRAVAPTVLLVQSDYGGEDAYFTSPVGGGALGVADGVGGWQDSGINPAGECR